jgi:hypothetical protein
MPQVGNVNYGGTSRFTGGRRNLYGHYLANPALTAAVLAATASVAASVVSTGIVNPDVARNIIATPGGTTTNVGAVSVTITGTNVEDLVITEVLPAFAAGSGASVAGNKAFKTVTSVSIPITGAATTVAIGTGSKLGLNRRMPFSTVLMAAIGGVREATPPTVTADMVNIENNTAILNTALSGIPVWIVYVDLQP